MKSFIIILSFLLLSCNGSNATNTDSYYDADHYNFSQHNRKTIKSIWYNEQYHGSYCYTVHILFTDGSHIDIAAYKYTQHIYIVN